MISSPFSSFTCEIFGICQFVILSQCGFRNVCMCFFLFRPFVWCQVSNLFSHRTFVIAIRPTIRNALILFLQFRTLKVAVERLLNNSKLKNWVRKSACDYRLSRFLSSHILALFVAMRTTRKRQPKRQNKDEKINKNNMLQHQSANKSNSFPTFRTDLPVLLRSYSSQLRNEK